MAGKHKAQEQRGKGGQQKPQQQQREQGSGQSRDSGGPAAQPVRQPAHEIGKQRPEERNR